MRLCPDSSSQKDTWFCIGILGTITWPPWWPCCPRGTGAMTISCSTFRLLSKICLKNNQIPDSSGNWLSAFCLEVVGVICRRITETGTLPESWASNPTQITLYWGLLSKVASIAPVALYFCPCLEPLFPPPTAACQPPHCRDSKLFCCLEKMQSVENVNETYGI